MLWLRRWCGSSADGDCQSADGAEGAAADAARHQGEEWMHKHALGLGKRQASLMFDNGGTRLVCNRNATADLVHGFAQPVRRSAAVPARYN